MIVAVVDDKPRDQLFDDRIICSFHIFNMFDLDMVLVPTKRSI